MPAKKQRELHRATHLRNHLISKSALLVKIPYFGIWVFVGVEIDIGTRT